MLCLSRYTRACLSSPHSLALWDARADPLVPSFISPCPSTPSCFSDSFACCSAASFSGRPYLPRFLGVLTAFAGLGWLTFLPPPLASHLSPYIFCPRHSLGKSAHGAAPL